MAKFEYQGERDYPGMVQTMGKTLIIRVKHKDGSSKDLKHPDGVAWKKGDTLTVTEEQAVRYLQADKRFKEI